MLRRPIVLAALLAFVETVLVLSFPEHFEFILPGAVLLLILCVFVSVKMHRKEFLIIFIPAIVICTLFPYATFAKYEKASYELVSDMQNSTEAEYTAIVDECKTYSSYSQLFVKLNCIDGKKLDYPLKARLGCYSPLYLEKGDTITFKGKPVRVTELENDTFDTTSYLRSKKIFIDFPACSVTSTSFGDYTSPISHLRSYTKKVIYRYVDQDMEFKTSSLCFAMFTGDKDFIPSEIKESFSESGLTHILCVSGMHLTLLAGACFSLLSLFSVHKKVKCTAIICLCIFYTVFTGISLSALRACIMCILTYTGMILGRKTDGYVSLFLSLLLIISFSPYSVFDISLILSFCATFGIIALSEFSVEYKGENILLKVLATLFNTFLSNLGAVIFTLAVCAFSFGGISIMSIASTMTVSVIFEVLLTLLLFLVIVSPLAHVHLPQVPDFLGEICDILCSAIIKISDFFSYFRYAKITSVFSEYFVLIFAVCLTLLTVFIAFELSFIKRLTVSFIVVIGVIFCIVSLIFTIYDDNQYKVAYFRQNENDRQLSVKLASQGYLLINADSTLCTDKKDLPFDDKYKSNYLLIIPDKEVIPSALAENIKIFHRRFGLQKVLVPKTQEGKFLSDILSNYGINCNYIADDFSAGNINVKHDFIDGSFRLDIDDKETYTQVIFGDKYVKEHFSHNADICAFFTRRTKTQFDLSKDEIPHCEKFITRLKKGEHSDLIENTFGAKRITIKG